jgi:hypothetical protein
MIKSNNKFINIMSRRPLEQLSTEKNEENVQGAPELSPALPSVSEGKATINSASETVGKMKELEEIEKAAAMDKIEASYGGKVPDSKKEETEKREQVIKELKSIFEQRIANIKKREVSLGFEGEKMGGRAKLEISREEEKLELIKEGYYDKLKQQLLPVFRILESQEMTDTKAYEQDKKLKAELKLAIAYIDELMQNPEVGKPSAAPVVSMEKGQEASPESKEFKEETEKFGKLSEKEHFRFFFKLCCLHGKGSRGKP